MTGEYVLREKKVSRKEGVGDSWEYQKTQLFFLAEAGKSEGINVEKVNEIKIYQSALQKKRQCWEP